MHSWNPWMWIQRAGLIVCVRLQHFYKGLDQLWILVSWGVLKPVPRKYQEPIVVMFLEVNSYTQIFCKFQTALQQKAYFKK